MPRAAAIPPAPQTDAKDAAERVSPAMAQYMELKTAHPDCLLFYRMGDFYELFFEDAEIASRILGIVLTKRGKHRGEDIPMAGVPVVRAEDYLHRLIAAGCRVAICEQMEEPADARKRGHKAVVARAVVRLVTAGTITEETLLPARASRPLVALARLREADGSWRYGLAAIDLAAGSFRVEQIEDRGLAAALARLEPAEIVAPEALLDDPGLRHALAGTGAALARLPREGVDSHEAPARIAAFFGVRTADAFGPLDRVEAMAAAMALGYIERTQLGARPALEPPRRIPSAGRLIIDAATRSNLELTRRLSGEREGSLLADLDRTLTPAGARLLAERLADPLADREAILDRQQTVAGFVADPALRQSLRARLREAPDLDRALGRLALDRGGPRDLAAVAAAIRAAHALARELEAAPRTPATPEHAMISAGLAGAPLALAERLDHALADDPPLHRRDGGFIRTGADPALDAARGLATDSRAVIAAMQARLAAELGIRTLRIKHTGFLGYFIEVPAKEGERLLAPPHQGLFHHRQTLQDAMRFSTAELAALDARINGAAEEALRRELEHFSELTAEVLAELPVLRAAAEAIARLDVATALAQRAAEDNWTAPAIGASGHEFAIEGLRHPVVESALRAQGQPFIGNPVDLSPPEGETLGRLLLVTGPNMAGKSTFLRQAALAVVLAQMGSFVPATAARIGIVDRLFSRVGAADDLARGRSTFMVEMVETAAILHQATERSLVILDEIGRGTATFDGLSIAWACLEHLHDRIGCRTLFATHHHELTALCGQLRRLEPVTLRVAEHGGEVIFLHEVRRGAADRSYGVQVARLAGLPAPVIARARAILDALEQHQRETPVDRLMADLPLFAAVDARKVPPPLAEPPAGEQPLREALAALDPDGMTPREALEALYDLKRRFS